MAPKILPAEASVANMDTSSSLRRRKSNKVHAALAQRREKEPTHALSTHMSVLREDATAASVPRVRGDKAQKPNVFVASWSDFTIGRHVSRLTGFVKAGQITAVLGPSGSGKSLLLRYLTGRAGDLTHNGELWYNGWHPHVSDSKAFTNFVPQQDLLVGVLTARDNLKYSAMLQHGKSAADVAHNVNSVLQELGLSRVADCAVSVPFKAGLSGGQKRRVSVGKGLLAMSTCSLVCFDEPTSGLDSTGALSVIKLIKKSAVSTKTGVILSIHQPNSSIVDVFDNVLLLNQAGQQVFFGTPIEALMFFSSASHYCPPSQSPMDFFIEVSNHKNNIAKLPAQYTGSPYFKHYVYSVSTQTLASLSSEISKKTKKTKKTFCRTFWTLLSRLLRIAVRDFTLYIFQIPLHIVFGVLIGLCFYQLGRTAPLDVIYVLLAICWYSNSVSYIHLFKINFLVETKTSFHHERLNHYYPALPFWCAELLMLAITSFLFLPGAVIGFVISGLPLKDLVYELGVLYVLSMLSETIVAVVVQVFDEPLLVAVVSQFLLIVFSLFYPSATVEIPKCLKWLETIAPSFSATTGIAISVCDQLDFNCQITDPNCQTNSGAANQTEVSISGSAYLRNAGYILRDSSKNVFLESLIVEFSALRLFLLVLYLFPVKGVVHGVGAWFKSLGHSVSQYQISVLQSENVALKIQMQFVFANMQLLHAKTWEELNAAALVVQRAWRRSKIYRRLSLAVAKINLLSQESERNIFIFKSMTLKLPKGKILVDDVSAVATGGRVLALMGPSGAGKTTLLNALAGRAPYARVSGVVTYNGQRFKTSNLSYVPQFNNLNHYLTVCELLVLRYRLKMTEGSFMEKVKEVAAMLGVEGQLMARCGDITGGQQKRVSIALGLLGDPQVLFLDEPTTGIDSNSAYQVVSYIQRLARELNKVVIMTIHQPSSACFNQLDDLLLLTQGKLAFFGPVSDCQPYFSSVGTRCVHENVADLILDAVNSEEKDWAARFKTSAFCRPLKTGLVSAATATKRPSEGARFMMLVRYLVLYYFRCPQFYLGRFGLLLLLALVSGGLKYQVGADLQVSSYPALNAMFSNSAWQMMFSVVAAIPVFVLDQRLVQEESFDSALTFSTHCVARLLVSLPFNFVGALLYTAVFWGLMDLPVEWEIYIYQALILFALSICTEPLVLIAVELLRNAMLCVSFSIVLLAVFLLLGGMFIQPGDLVVFLRWVPGILPSYYVYNGMVQNLFPVLTFYTHTPIGKFEVPGKQLVGSLISDDHVPTNKWVLLAITFGFALVSNVAFLGIIKFNNRKYGRMPLSPTISPEPGETQKQQKDAVEMVVDIDVQGGGGQLPTSTSGDDPVHEFQVDPKPQLVQPIQAAARSSTGSLPGQVDKEREDEVTFFTPE